ncbi:MAG TPA: hypothetical protein VF695_02415 [Sphingomonas sp.]|jgi:hypothetical protein
MRISSALVLLLAACSSEPAPNTVPANAQVSAAPEADTRILCARGQDALARTCTVDQMEGEGGLTLTIRHPDGGFHRLLVTGDERGVAAADGAEPARVTLVGDREIEVAIGNTRYRLPATTAPAR